MRNIEDILADIAAIEEVDALEGGLDATLLGELNSLEKELEEFAGSAE